MSILSFFGEASRLSRRTSRASHLASRTIRYVLLLFIGASAWAVAQASESVRALTMAEALRIAESRSGALEAQDAATRSSRERAIAASQLPDPTLQLAIDNLPVNGEMGFRLTDDFMTMRSVGFMQTYIRKEKRRARRAEFEREADVSQSTRAVFLAELREQTALAWFELYYQQQLLDLMVDQRDESQHQVKAAEAAFRGGRGSEADVFSARSMVARIENNLHELRAGVTNAQATLARWTGDSITFRLGEAPSIHQTLLASHSLDHQVDQHPELALMTAEERVALARAEAARQEKRADWTWSLMVSQRGSEYSDMVSVGISIPLQWNQKRRQDREVAAQLARVDQVRAEREEMRRSHRLEIQQLLTNWRAQLARLDGYNNTLIPLATQRSQAALAAYQGGKEPLDAVLEARRTEIETRVERLQIEMEAAALWTELEFLIPVPSLIETPAETSFVSPTLEQNP